MQSKNGSPDFRGKLLVFLSVAAMAAVVFFGPAGLGIVTASADTTYLISDNGKVSSHTTSATDPEDILAEAGLELGIDDTYTVTESNGQTEIQVQRIRTVTIDNGGQLLRTGTYGESVGEVLERLNIHWDEDDLVSQPMDAETVDGMEIVITRRTITTESHARTLPFEEIRQEDPDLPEGLEKVLTAGSDGEVLVTEQVICANGTESERRILSEEVTRPPVNQIVTVGTAPAAEHSGKLWIGDGVIVTPEGDVLTYTGRRTMTATAYTCEATGGVGITATGTPARVGAIAVDPTVIPYGTRMYILTQDGYAIYGIATAEDTGHPDFICGNRIDLYYDTEAECVQFGVRKCDVYILG